MNYRTAAEYGGTVDCWLYLVLGAFGLFATAFLIDAEIEGRKKAAQEELERQKLAERWLKWSEDFERDYAKLKKKARKRDIDKK